MYKLVKQSDDTWGIVNELGELVMTGKTLTVVSNVLDALNGNGNGIDEAEEIADVINPMREAVQDIFGLR